MSARPGDDELTFAELIDEAWDRLEEGDEAGGRAAALEAAATAAGADLDAEQAVAFCDLLLAIDEPARALPLIERVVRDEPDWADGWHVRGLVAEALDDEAGKVQAWLHTRRLDQQEKLPAGWAHMTEAEFARVAEKALAELPERARELLQNVPIVVVDLPAQDDVRTGLDPRLLGLFAGTPYPEDSSMGGLPQVTQILLFRRNLELASQDRRELRDQIRITLLHETGHFFGLDEDELEALGLD